MKTLNYYLYTFIIFLCISKADAQSVKGVVYESNNKNEIPLIGANVYWINTTKAVVTDFSGNFEISEDGITDKRLIVSFVGYQNDTINITNQKFIKIILKSAAVLNAVEITKERSASMISVQPLKTEILTAKELKKAACCNLGESFETNASVDITYKDALSGSKEVQVLGLSGAYTQILTEDVPLINGLGLTYGLNSIPGTQIDAINIVKGPGSVVLGHESISGMVNVDLKDPSTADRLFLNAYLNHDLRKELNVDKAIKLNDRLSSLVSFHADHFSAKIDNNDDSFIDMPLLSNYSLLNKWKFNNGRGLLSQNSIKYLYEERMGGQTFFDFEKNEVDSSAYGQKLQTNRIEFYGRIGYVIPSPKYNSVGFQYAVVNHKQKGFYGFNEYEGYQDLLSLRLLYNRELTKNNSLNLGLSYKYNSSKEKAGNLILNKKELIPGIFAENTFQRNKILALITGIRADLYEEEVILTSRANIKYSLKENTDIRASAGTGWKTTDILAENPSILASSRSVEIVEDLNIEQAVNFGFNINHAFKLFYREASIGMDIYKAIFSNKIIPDFDTDPTKVFFSNLKGISYSDNLQLEIIYEFVKNVELKLAYKYLDVYSRLDGNKTQQAFIAKDRLLSTLFYESFNRKWTANISLQWYGKKKMPNSSFYPEVYQRNSYSLPYSVYNIQANRIYKNVELYVGMENIFDLVQEDAIVSADQPYGPYFDSSFIWGPLEGRKIYGGIRYRIK